MDDNPDGVDTELDADELSKAIAASLSNGLLDVNSSFDSYIRGIKLDIMAQVIKNISDPKIMSTSKEFIKAAKLDLHASKSLRDVNPPLYPLAIYHLQQAVEKISKAFYYMITGELPEFTHETSETIITMVKKIKDRMYVDSSDIDKSLSKYQLFSGAYDDSSEKRKFELLNATEEEIVAYLDAFSIIMSPLESVDLQPIFDMLKDNQVFLRGVAERSNNKISIDKMKELIKDPEAAKKQIPFALSAIRLIILAPLLSHHESYTRYPFVKRYEGEQGLGISDYNQNLGIVKAFDKVYGEVEILVNGFFLSDTV